MYSAPSGYTYIGDGICVKKLGIVGESASIIKEGQWLDMKKEKEILKMIEL